MAKLVLKKDWPGLRGVMHAGEYRIPQDISLGLAKCARLDGAGEIVGDNDSVKPASEAPTTSNVPAGGRFPPETKEQPRETKPTPANPLPPVTGSPGKGGKRPAKG